MLRYIGDSKNIRNRVRQHCKGNVESSALRKTIAREMGLDVRAEKRLSGSSKYTIHPLSGEEMVSSYIQSGTWKVISCQTAEDARDFQWYAIDNLRPMLNKYMQFWNKNSEGDYQELLDEMLRSNSMVYTSISTFPTQPGVYSLWHDSTPVDFAKKT